MGPPLVDVGDEGQGTYLSPFPPRYTCQHEPLGQYPGVLGEHVLSSVAQAVEVGVDVILCRYHTPTIPRPCPYTANALMARTMEPIVMGWQLLPPNRYHRTRMRMTSPGLPRGPFRAPTSPSGFPRSTRPRRRTAAAAAEPKATACFTSPCSSPRQRQSPQPP